MSASAGTPLPVFLIAYSESGFTNPHEAMLPEEPRDCRGKFTHMGAQYWGFESRRHKTTTVLADEQALLYDHDAFGWMQIGLRKRAEVKSVHISTKWYTGNQVRGVSVFFRDALTGTEKQVLDRVALNPDSEHVFDIPSAVATECFVKTYHDGGISRVSLFGDETQEQQPEYKNLLEDAHISHVSNEHYGNPDRAVKGGRKEMHMYGWESARTGFGEQALFHLKAPSVLREIIVDTYLYRLNAPLTSHVFALQKPADKSVDELMAEAPRWKIVLEGGREIIPADFRAYMLAQKFTEEKQSRFRIRLHMPEGTPWKPVLPFAPLSPDTWHRFTAPEGLGPVTHLLYMHYPNGGIHGLKALGRKP